MLADIPLIRAGCGAKIAALVALGKSKLVTMRTAEPQRQPVDCADAPERLLHFIGKMATELKAII
jgi:hypothetical protein